MSELNLDAEPERKPQVRKRTFGGRLKRFAVLLILAVVALPLVLVPIYAMPTTRPVSTLMLSEHFAFQPYDRQWVPLEDIAPVLVRSVMMSEDGQFCAHGGVDWAEFAGVMDRAFSSDGPSRGASTIPMQTVKNLFLWNGRSYVRKGLELPLAMYADTMWTKRRMMEIYLNVAEWGPGVYGIEAASRYYFNRPAADLSSRQAALLAVTLPSPLSRDPAKPSAGLARMADRIQARARASGDYTQCLDLGR
ncbi:monofunctional biosynthetic peptidoglycan transglycosylase [Aureimonas altamirensis]|jgi:monofunctional glycosyltransferase|uniref:Biosynthetic peptidoglycan transglycosylase n=1 Tax=Aureimonas altamirensis DSM 21988 TaxID=1121026 RepID=A0ABY1INN0_9HYPH|nr:monofunctional biosynthetic peptidoglycan transglycosylase [Aureimonas altamirensis]SHJ68329.1 monofunctional biosynthetic peptidoglycan transglycosylase [Aureimonas altamirensis DSM 21988]